MRQIPLSSLVIKKADLIDYFNTSYFIHKKLKLLIEVTFEPISTFTISPKLTMFLNQYGLYELDKFNKFVTNYFNNLVS